jgi:hypothetical protein
MHRRDILTSGLAAGSVAALASARPAAAQARKPATVYAKDGARLFHRDWGEGQPVVFVSSWGLSSEMWAWRTCPSTASAASPSTGADMAGRTSLGAATKWTRSPTIWPPSSTPWD